MKSMFPVKCAGKTDEEIFVEFQDVYDNKEFEDAPKIPYPYDKAMAQHIL